MHHFRISAEEKESDLNCNYIYTEITVSAYPCFVSYKDNHRTITEDKIIKHLTERVQELYKEETEVDNLEIENLVLAILVFIFSVIFIIQLITQTNNIIFLITSDTPTSQLLPRQ